MAYEVSGTTPEGLVNPNPIDRTGGAIVLPDAEISPDKVLWYSIQREDQERKKNQQAARKALSDLNDIRVNGWANHLTELNQQKSDLLDKASSYLQKYKGKSWEEFDPRNAQQAKEALDIQKQLSNLKEMEAFSEQVKQWHQFDTNAYKGKEANFTPESIQGNTDFYKKPLSEAYQDFSSTGERPILEQAFPDWRTKAMQAAKGVGTTQQLTKREADGRIVTVGYQDVPEQENQMAFDGFLMTPQGKQALTDTARETKLTGDALTNYIKSHYWDNFQNRKDRYENIASPVTTAQEKEKAVVGEPVTVDKIVTAPPTDKEGAAYIPLQYGGKHTYYDQFAPITAKNDQQLKNFAGSAGEVYKVVKTNQGNFQTQSVSADEKANFHPAGVMVNSKTGEAALIMTAKNPKAVEPTDSQIKAQMTDEQFKEYMNKETLTDKADEIYADAKAKAIEKSTKGAEDVQYLAPIDASLESKYNTIVSQPLKQTFPSRKNWTEKSQNEIQLTPDAWNKKWATLKRGEKLVGLDGKTYTKQ